ncbi:bifunctional 5,10-methylenetetrahydrofolate dehydrogenase/5,10-methenyltetrahydrofolate cyclohydrolase [Salinigranum sp. GCM10025319]|uniref:bifunctional 5,10-methylenetetrahydrofolate dehydrogenase/5,10-methenyltetrahydrofolate cyclohydrolase n=1 Tax=Salinigranum sp. GCM10025319 TaxID=3252687 RepID=UPI00361ACFEF
MPTKRLLGEPVAERLRTNARDRTADLRERGHVPTLGTVLASDDRAAGRFMDLKHDACDDVGIETRDHRLGSDVSDEELFRVVERLSTDPTVDAVFVQTPLPPEVSTLDIGSRIDPRKDVDCFHPENRGLLVGGDPRFVPATVAAVEELLAAYDVSTDGRDVVIVGRSDAIGVPLANRLLQKSGGNATVTVCHSHTRDLAAKTRTADVVVTACGVPELVDGSMLSPGVVVVDVSANRRRVDGEREVVGDVDYESAKEKSRAITPVPGGVGPVTLATLLGNVVLAAERRTDGE